LAAFDGDRVSGKFGANSPDMLMKRVAKLKEDTLKFSRVFLVDGSFA